MSDHLCVLCPVYRPDTKPRFADTVCRADRYRIERDLLAVGALYARMIADEEAVVDEQWYWMPLPPKNGIAGGEWRRREPLAVFDGAGAVAARTVKPVITGTRVAPIPINVDAFDLTAPARAALPLGEPGDQIGFLPVASVLDAWARYVRRQLHPDFHLPGDQVDALVAVLHRDLDDVCDRMPDVLPQLACDLRALAAAMRVVLRDTEPVPQPLLGVRCGNCRKMSTLVEWPGGQYTECGACGQLYNPADRDALGKAQVADVFRPRHVRLSGALPNLAT